MTPCQSTAQTSSRFDEKITEQEKIVDDKFMSLRNQHYISRIDVSHARTYANSRTHRQQESQSVSQSINQSRTKSHLQEASTSCTRRTSRTSRAVLALGISGEHSSNIRANDDNNYFKLGARTLSFIPSPRVSCAILNAVRLLPCRRRVTENYI